jgi:hypothetical protein
MRSLFDLFPAHLAVAPAGLCELRDMTAFPPPKGAYRVEKTRVIVTDTHIIVASDTDSGPSIIFQERYSEFIKNNRSEDSYVETLSGKLLAFRRDDDCGCGSRLRGWNPFSVMNSVNDPTE